MVGKSFYSRKINLNSLQSLIYVHTHNAHMTNITLAVPETLFEKMKEHPEFNWSEVARQAIKEKMETLELLDKLTSKSKMSMNDAVEIGEIIKKSAWKKLKKDNL